jgi:hypothetical protein
MTDIGLTAKIGESTTKFEIWFRKRKPNDTFTLQSMSEEIKQVWTEEISKLLWKQALRNRGMFFIIHDTHLVLLLIGKYNASLRSGFICSEYICWQIFLNDELNP